MNALIVLIPWVNAWYFLFACNIGLEHSIIGGIFNNAETVNTTK